MGRHKKGAEMVFSPRKFRELCTSKGMSLADVQRALSDAGVRSLSSAMRWANGKGAPNSKSFRKLATILECQMEELMEPVRAVA